MSALMNMPPVQRLVPKRATSNTLFSLQTSEDTFAKFTDRSTAVSEALGCK